MPGFSASTTGRRGRAERNSPRLSVDTTVGGTVRVVARPAVRHGSVDGARLSPYSVNRAGCQSRGRSVYGSDRAAWFRGPRFFDAAAGAGSLIFSSAPSVSPPTNIRGEH